MKLSVIISSFNQQNRLKRSLDSACDMKCRFADDIEIIVADDNSTDGSIELIEQYPVKLSLGKRSKSNKYTLANNWTDAVVNVATGDRVIFTNGDHIFTTYFADSHADPVMSKDIIFGPAFQSSPNSLELIENNWNDYMDLVEAFEKNKLLLPDRHAEGSAMTYNKVWDYWFPFGYNFSVLREHFIAVGGFPEKEEWGGEESALCKKIIQTFPGTKVKSNKNSVAIHMYHPIVNHEKLYGGPDYRF